MIYIPFGCNFDAINFCPIRYGLLFCWQKQQQKMLRHKITHPNFVHVDLFVTEISFFNLFNFFFFFHLINNTHTHHSKPFDFLYVLYFLRQLNLLFLLKCVRLHFARYSATKNWQSLNENSSIILTNVKVFVSDCCCCELIETNQNVINAMP